MLAIEIRQLEKSYPRSHFRLYIEELEVETGSILGLLGPNGAGKTTLLNLLMDIVRPNHGKITILGQAAGERSQLLPLLSYMPENKKLYADMSVQQLLKLASGMVPGYSQQRAQELLAHFPLDQRKRFRALSFGEKTQLYAIITFAREAEIYILDEPTRGLDPVMQNQMLGLIKEVSMQEKTVVFSSHQLDEIEEAADSIALINRGQTMLAANLDDIKGTHFRVEVEAKFLDQLRPTGLVVISSEVKGDKAILLCRGDHEERKRLSISYSFLEPEEVNLKDIYLSLMHTGRDGI